MKRRIGLESGKVCELNDVGMIPFHAGRWNNETQRVEIETDEDGKIRFQYGMDWSETREALKRRTALERTIRRCIGGVELHISGEHSVEIVVTPRADLDIGIVGGED